MRNDQHKKRETQATRVCLLAALAVTACNKTEETHHWVADDATPTIHQEPALNTLTVQTTARPSRESTCPKMTVCCSDPNAPAGVLIACGGYAEGKLYKDCDDNVAAVLRMYADPVLNKAKAKPPAGCAN